MLKIAELENYINDLENDTRRNNQIVSWNQCENNIHECFHPLNLKIQGNDFNEEDMEHLEDDFRQLTDKYDHESKGPAKF